MTTATQQRNGGKGQATQQQPADLSRLMQQILDTPISPKLKALDEALADRVDRIEELLPHGMKGQGARLAKRAILTLNRKANDYERVTPQSFVRCVLEAAELGLAIDGKLCHAVVFNNKVKRNGKDEWVSEAQLMVDYKGLVAVARRSGIILDCYARLVFEADKFRAYDEDGESHLFHEACLGPDRGELVGAYAVVKLPGGEWRYEWMASVDIDAVRARSKSWKGGAGFGPWKTDDGEMRKKTVIRRILKLYCDDPAFVRAAEIDDREYEEHEVSRVQGRVLELPTGRHGLRDLGTEPQADDVPEQPEPHEPQAETAAKLEQDADALEHDLCELLRSCGSRKKLTEAGQQVTAARETLGDARAERVEKVFQECWGEAK